MTNKIIVYDNGSGAAFHLRHKIFCEGLGVIPTNKAQLEIDEFDGNSRHFLVVVDEIAKGVGRVILPPKLQFKEFIRLYPEDAYLYNLPGIVEVSRIASDKAMVLDELIMAAMTIMIQEGSKGFIIVVAPKFANVLIKKGILLTQVGELQYLYGDKAPYHGDMSTIMFMLKANHSKLYNKILKEVENECKEM